MTKKIIISALIYLVCAACLLFLSFLFTGLLKEGSLERTKVWLDFIAQIVSSMAWPICLATLVYILRKPLVRILASVTKISAGGVDVVVTQALDTAEEVKIQSGTLLNQSDEQQAKRKEVAQTVSSASESADITTALTEMPSVSEAGEQRAQPEPDFQITMEAIKEAVRKRYQKALITRDDPNEAITNKWAEVEQCIRRLYKSTIVEKKNKTTQLVEMINSLVTEKIVTLEEFEIIKQLRKITVRVKYDNAILATSDAYRFIELADGVINRWLLLLASKS